jgi:hypothetical protein
LSVFNEANIFPLGFEPESCALARLAAIENEQTSLVIYNSTKDVLFCFEEKGVVLFSKSLKYESNLIDSQLVFTEAEKAVAFWINSCVDDKKIEKVFLAGNFGDEEFLKKAVENKFGVKLEKLPLPIIIPPKIPENKLAGAISLFGLAFSPKDSKLSVSLIPEKVKKRREVFRHQRKLKNLIKITALFISLLLSLYFFVFLSIFFRIEEVKASLAGMEKIKFTKEQKELEEKAVNLNKKISALDKLIATKGVGWKKFDYLPRLIPAGVRVTNFYFDAGEQTLELRGEAANRNAVLTLEKELADLGEVTVPLASFQESENLEFTAIVSLKKK